MGEISTRGEEFVSPEADPNIIRVQKQENKEKLKVLYTADFVKDVQDLLQKFPPKHKKIFGHHSTIAFKPESLDGIEVGKESLMKIIARVFDEKGDALLVENTRSTNEHPHITLSCAEGVSPVYSKELIKNAIEAGIVEYFETPENIQVIEGYFDGKKDVTE